MQSNCSAIIIGGGFGGLVITRKEAERKIGVICLRPLSVGKLLW